MASVAEPMRRSPFTEHHSASSHYSSGLPTNLPIMTVSAPSPRYSNTQPMDISEPSPTDQSGASNSPTGDRGSEKTTSPSEQQQEQTQQNQNQQSQNGASNPPAGAATAAQQPKVVQTAFIHKLYNMLEDQSIQHLISWSNSNESFVMSPSSEFSKVLAQYFKHTNVSSFVRQLNMYGFHKVSDVFHTSTSDSPLWEFKHGQGNFKRGNTAALRDIKRRASRHSLITRDTFSNAAAPKMPAPVAPGARHESLQPSQEPIDPRSQMLDWSLNDLHARLARTEEAYNSITTKCQTLLEGLTKCHQWNQELSTHLLSVLPDSDSSVRRDIFAMREDIARHTIQLRTLDDSSPNESIFTNKQPFGAGPPPQQPSHHHSIAPLEPSLPMSPRQRPFDESRRPSLQGLSSHKLGNSFRPPVPSHLQTPPRRYGSIGTGNGMQSPSSRGSYLPPPPLPHLQQQQTQQQQPTMQHPLANDSNDSSSNNMNLARRHTSADIRVEGWQGGIPPPSLPHPSGGHSSTAAVTTNNASSPYASGQSSSAFPSSPRGGGGGGGVGGGQQHPHEHQQLRDALAQYDFPRPSISNNNHTGNAAGSNSSNHHLNASGSRQSSPPLHEVNNNGSGNSGFGNSQQAAPSYANTNDAGWQLPGPRYPSSASFFNNKTSALGGLETPGSQTRRSSMASNVHSLLNPAADSSGAGSGAERGEGEKEREKDRERERERERDEGEDRKRKRARDL